MTRLQFDSGGGQSAKNTKAGLLKKTDLILTCRRNQMQKQPIGAGSLPTTNSQSVMAKQELVAAGIVARKSRGDCISQIANGGDLSDVIENIYHVEDTLVEANFVHFIISLTKQSG